MDSPLEAEEASGGSPEPGQARESGPSGGNLSRYAGLKDRDLSREGVFVAEGRFLTERLLASPLAVESVLCLPSLEEEFLALMERRPAGLRAPVMTLSRGEMESLCGFPFHRGVLAAAPRPAAASPGDCFPPPGARRLVYCSGIADPFNLGGIIRSAAALGWDGVILADGCGDHLARGALRASMGAVFSLPWLTLPGRGGEYLTGLEGEGFLLTGAVIPRPGAGDIRHSRGREKTVLLLGNEGAGLPEELIRRCGTLVTIPMAAGVDSLNVGAAAGILLHALGPSGGA